jgi:hypothetical protein
MELLDQLRQLVARDDVLVTVHAQSELAADGILLTELLGTIDTATVIEAYPQHNRGPCFLARHETFRGVVHAVWGLRKGTDRPAVLITAYRPNPTKWNQDATRRLP